MTAIKHQHDRRHRNEIESK